MNNSIAFMAPHNLPQTTIVLPNPKLSNDTLGVNEVIVKPFIDGSFKTYKRTSSRKIFSMSFELTQDKDEELRRFVEAYTAHQWRFYHWDQTTWAVHLRAPSYSSVTSGIDEYKEASLEVEGFRLT